MADAGRQRNTHTMPCSIREHLTLPWEEVCGGALRAS